MSCNNNSRAELNGDRIALEATGNVLSFQRSGLTYYAKNGNSTTAGTCPTYTSLPPGLRFTLDNSYGTGTMTITPTSGTAISLTSGKSYDFYVDAEGGLRAGELAAHPQ
jgi:hypothetical protein